MDLSELLSQLDMPPGEGYYRSRIPCPEDERIARGVRAVSEARPGRPPRFPGAAGGGSARPAPAARPCSGRRWTASGPGCCWCSASGSLRWPCACRARSRSCRASSPRRWPRRAIRARRSPCRRCTGAARRSSGWTRGACSTRRRAGRTSPARAGCATCATRRMRRRTSATRRPTTARASATSGRSPASRAAAELPVRCGAVTAEPRDPHAHTEVHRVADPSATRVASYLANPGEVGRVLLLYSGGLDTSVMLKWIQDEYEAEVVALTINLGQPGEDYEVVRGKALQLGALDCHVVDAREEFARE